jgi:uncharacterized protein YndB with AHSA1/START domain
MTAQEEFAAKTEGDREIVLVRVLNAPLERVWRAWTDPVEVAKWWGPHGFKTTTDNREFKTGGIWKHAMIGPDGVKYPNSAKFVEIVDRQKIVFTNGGAGENMDPVRFTATVTFKALGGDKTELTMRQVFDTPEFRDTAVKVYGAVEGGRQTMSKLAAHLAGDFTISRLLDAPREKVWRAWTTPAALAQWMSPKGFAAFHAQGDIKPGGVYHYGIKGPGGMEMWGLWKITEAVPPERLVFVQQFSDKDGGLGSHPMAPTWPRYNRTTILLADFGGKTLLTLYWSPVDATAVERETFAKGMEGMTAGWNGTFEHLDAWLKEAK